MRFYIATRFDNKIMHRRVRCALERLGHEITHDWTQVEEAPTLTDAGRRRHGQADLRGVAEADFAVVIMPGARGTHVELGAALALGKPVFLCARNEDEFLVSGVPLPFYYLPGVIKLVGEQPPAIVGQIHAHLMAWPQDAPESAEPAFGTPATAE